MLNKIKCNWFK